MFQVTEKASEAIRQFLEGREGPRSVRLLMDDEGWRGPHLIMALDEPKADDQVLTEKGITFLVARKLFDQAKPISIDYVINAMGGGYMLQSNLIKTDASRCDHISETCYPHG